MSDFITNGISSYYTDSATGAASSVNGLEGTLKNSDFSNSTDEELMKVCKDFEAYFLEQVMKSMQKMIPKDEEEEDSSMSMMTDYFKDEMISKYASIATESNGGKGFGIAQTLFEQMKRNYSSPVIPQE